MKKIPCTYVSMYAYNMYCVLIIYMILYIYIYKVFVCVFVYRCEQGVEYCNCYKTGNYFFQDQSESAFHLGKVHGLKKTKKCLVLYNY